MTTTNRIVLTQMLLNQKVEEQANGSNTLLQGRVREMRTGAKKILVHFLRIRSLTQISYVAGKVSF